MTKARNLADLLNADGQIDNADIADNTIANAKLAQTPNFRNIIINGDMSIAQRGTSVTGISSGNIYHTVDRFATELGGLGTWTQTQSTDVPSGQGFAKSLKMDCTTADASPAVSDYAIIKQKVEGQNLQYLKKGTSNAESVTMSFWVKSNKTGTYIVELADRDNNRKISQAYTINTADTWEKKTITFAGDTTGAFDNNNNASLDCYFWLGAGTTFTSGTLNTSWSAPAASNRAAGQVNLADDTANEWYITGVQLEAGTTASDFEFLPYDVNLQRCQRYFIKYDLPTGTGLGATSSWGAAVNTTNVDCILSLPVTMRVSASSMSLGVNTLQVYIVATSSLFSSGTFSIPYNTNNNNISIRYVHGSGVFTAGQVVGLLGNGTTGYLTLSAEL